MVRLIIAGTAIGSCPFAASSAQSNSTVAGVKCYPGIGYSVMKPRRDKPAMLAEQVQALRDADFEGFTDFDCTPITSRALLDQFGE